MSLIYHAALKNGLIMLVFICGKRHFLVFCRLLDMGKMQYSLIKTRNRDSPTHRCFWMTMTHLQSHGVVTVANKAMLTSKILTPWSSFRQWEVSESCPLNCSPMDILPVCHQPMTFLSSYTLLSLSDRKPALLMQSLPSFLQHKGRCRVNRGWHDDEHVRFLPLCATLYVPYSMHAHNHSPFQDRPLMLRIPLHADRLACHNSETNKLHY